MSLRVVILLLAVVLMNGCKQRWEESEEIGSFVLIRHYFEYSWSPELSHKRGVDYTEICNKATGECYLRGRPTKHGELTRARISFAKDNRYAVLYINNINGSLLKEPAVMFFNGSTGEFYCSLNESIFEMGAINGVNFQWGESNGVGKVVFSDNRGGVIELLFFVSLENYQCKINELKRWFRPLGDYSSGPLKFDSSLMKVAWGECENSECKAVVLDVQTAEERYIPSRSCGRPMLAGSVHWENGVLKHRCSKSDVIDLLLAPTEN